MADVLGNQEYINNLSSQEPNIFKKIYQEVKYLYHQLRGYKNQSQFIEDLMYKFESVYRKNEINLNSNTKFFEIYNNNGTVNRIKINENIFEDNNGKSINQTIKEYLEQHIGDVYTIIEADKKFT